MLVACDHSNGAAAVADGRAKTTEKLTKDDTPPKDCNEPKSCNDLHDSVSQNTHTHTHLRLTLQPPPRQAPPRKATAPPPPPNTARTVTLARRPRQACSPMHEVGEGAQAHVSIECVAYAQMGCPAAALACAKIKRRVTAMAPCVFQSSIPPDRSHRMQTIVDDSSALASCIRYSFTPSK